MPRRFCYNFTSLTEENVAFNVSGWTKYEIGEKILPLYDCGELSEPNSIYSLQNSVTSLGTCFTISVENVTLNCRSWRIKLFTDKVYCLTSIPEFTQIKIIPQLEIVK